MVLIDRGPAANSSRRQDEGGTSPLGYRARPTELRYRSSPVANMPSPTNRSARTRLVALAVLLAVSVPLVILAASGGGGEDEPEDDLLVERSTQRPEMILYVTPDLNRPERAGDRRMVTLECIDAEGRVLASQPERWPLTETDQGTLDPHAHVPMDPAQIGEVARCRVHGTEPLMEAPVL
jgi:hypothetical protein